MSPDIVTALPGTKVSPKARSTELKSNLRAVSRRQQEAAGNKVGAAETSSGLEHGVLAQTPVQVP